ncbi:hypothetical protein GCM10020218_103420 [Dactylosporangium vinaceum]
MEYQAKYLGHPLEPGTPLLIREGAALHEMRGEVDRADAPGRLPRGRRRVRHHRAHARRLRADAPAGERPAGEPSRGDFLAGLMGWMLPGPDHSMAEIMLGADLVGAGVSSRSTPNTP